MARNYAQLQQQIKKLQAEAEKLRRAEMRGVIDRIKVAIAHYGLTTEQLFGAAPKVRAAKAAAGATYSDGQGRTWGGKGKRPDWLREALAAGRGLDEFKVAGGARQPARRAKAAGKPKKKRVTHVLFRDSAGHAWTGMGPRPQWLKDAIASGQSEESLRV
jgi:DNA-binding protein H-NS